MAEKLNLGRLITFLVRIFQIGGLWKPKNDDTFRRLYIVYSWLFNFIFSVMYTAFMCANLYFIEDISQLTDMLVMSMTELALVLKIVNFYVNNSKLQEMLRRMHEFQLENEFEHTVMRSRLSFLAKSTILYYFCANTSFNTSTLSAMLSKQTKLIYSAYYPGMDWKHNTVAYWSLFGYQYVGILYTTCINLAIDSYFCIMMYMLAGQTIILGSRLSNIGARVGGMRKTTIEQRLELIKNIKTHNDIIEFIQNLQHCLWWSFSGQLFLSTIVMGSYAKEMLQAVSFNYYLPNVATAMAFIMQILLMCFHGQCIMTESEILPTRIYESNWFEKIDARRDGDYGKILYMFMERLKQNGQILIGKLFPLSLNTFKVIMSTAYRLLALLR